VSQPSVRLRQATQTDGKAVAAMCEDIWTERGGDYIPAVYDRWMESEGPSQQTIVAIDQTEMLVGIVQGVMLTETEAWAQALRVAGGQRGRGVGRRLIDAVVDRAARRDAGICRTLVFSWNAAGLGVATTAGFEPAMAFRWAMPAVGTSASAPNERVVAPSASAVAKCFDRTPMAAELAGLTLDWNERWALSRLGSDPLAAASGQTERIGIEDPTTGELTACSVRIRTCEETNAAGQSERLAEYALTGWHAEWAVAPLFEAIGSDAASVGADSARVLLPEKAERLAAAAAARVELSEYHHYVMTTVPPCGSAATDGREQR